jgi:hypothetical protein
VALPVILANWGAESRRIMVQGQPRQIAHETPISKITRVKWTEDVAQAGEHLLCKHKGLSSNLVPPKNKIKRKNDGLTILLMHSLILKQVIFTHSKKNESE